MAEKIETAMPVESGTTRSVPAPRRTFDPFVEMRERMDRMFDSMFGTLTPFGQPFGRLRGAAPPVVMPHVDITETAEALTITAELPGLDDKDVSLTLLDGVLTVKGEKRAEKEEKDEAKSYHLVERSYGSFTRSFRLPETVDPEKVSATFDKGVLTITLPRTAEVRARVRQIPIGGAGETGPATTH
ncbi:Hsp20/alpha crystallin family protein [Azospirillum halopraeferens]|uniref:Hsp20/alpha crystallin family protein n=1 Tax=Azospirillum halopraeferens TaxID=34010 RepID=UPI00040F2555|nr:Hsp20/alpha crystallin family protein [Azospirillum halopraeferens]